MAMEMRLNLKMSQKLVMTPMLQQAIKLLPLARLELAQLVRQEIVENPILEEIFEEDIADSIEEENEEPVSEAPPEENFSVKEPENPLEGKETTSTEEVDWDSLIQNNIDQGLSSDQFIDNNMEMPSFEATCRKEITLAEHLLWQLGLALDTDEDKFIGTFIIGNIQSDGYLRIEMEELFELCQYSEEKVLNVLSVVQTFEPTGVGARNLQECLAIQARAMPERNSLVEILIDGYIHRLDERQLAKIASELKCNVTKVVQAFKQIQELVPKPGLVFTSEASDYVSADLEVIVKDGEYDVVLVDGEVPNIRINPYYHKILKNSKETETKEFLEDKYKSAVWLIKSIDQRKQTIYKVGKSIVKLQKDFLDRGLSYLKPMVLKEVADDIGMHESTVSRITTNKYIDTPQGLLELKFFFHNAIKSYMGNNISSLRVKNMITELVKEEDLIKPFTDDKIVELLSKKNTKIARRTVTKYRKELNIPAAGKRKRLF
jgi:RNA polymerase sigma-54 factor